MVFEKTFFPFFHLKTIVASNALKFISLIKLQYFYEVLVNEIISFFDYF